MKRATAAIRPRTVTMTPEAAVVRICETMARMKRLYGRAVFDEWALIALAGSRGRVVGYEGVRRSEFVRQLPADLGPLRAELGLQLDDPGAFGFARDAEGPRFDAFIVAGPATVLLLNNTAVTVSAIAADPLWRKAQVPFAELAEIFRADPIEPMAVDLPAAASSGRSG